MAMSLTKFSRYITSSIRQAPRYLSSGKSEGGKGKSGDPNDPENLTDLQIPDGGSGSNNPSEPTMYDCRKYGHCLPCNSAAPCFEILPYIPTGIFRCTYGEVLGRGANKGTCYQNPEYFSYHHMTFYDMHLILRPCRQPSPKTGRKP